MTIRYAAVYNSKGVVLVDSSAVGNCAVVSIMIMEKIKARQKSSREQKTYYQSASPSHKNVYSIQYDFEHCYHILRDDKSSTHFLCMTTGGTLSVPLRVVYGFLEALQHTFSAKFDAKTIASTTTAYSLRSAFQFELESAMHTYNTNPPSQQSESTRALLEKIDKAKDAVSVNISELLERGEKVELLLDKSEALEVEARVFKKTATEAERRLYNQKMVWAASIATAVLLVVLLLTVSACGIDFSYCRKSSSN
ncbi:hypothetical protein TrLO_g8961 [Triparma laevis f. longispina]|uniref:V-SNARE coiled-coil homology domain-containing protein n=1 Tax=Triparma laevis f. longispina TaxID=1714387 RepID=A0A9W7FV68_9STRA|nr:hypothetical protein TrLO_g8961 [Triparma laevis f. longispina]